jgi:hypothetical protein
MIALGGRKLLSIFLILAGCQTAAESKQQSNRGGTPSRGGGGNVSGTDSSVVAAQAGSTKLTDPPSSGGVSPGSTVGGATSKAASGGRGAVAGAPTGGTAVAGMPNGGVSSGGRASGGTKATATAGAPASTQELTLTKANARIGGSRGDQLFVDVEGKATLGSFASVELGLGDAAGTPLLFFDNDWDYVLDSSSGRVVPTKMPTAVTFTTEVLLNGVRKLNGLSELQVALVDRNGLRTEPVGVTIQQQPIVELGGACDPKFVTNRCREGLSCSGTPTVCVDGTAPTITQASFQRSPDGPFILADGLDPDEDVILVRIDFFTTANAPILLDLDGDDAPEADHLEVGSGITNQNGGYQFVVQSGLNFDVLVPRLGLTAIDSKGNESATQRVSISNRTTRTSGQSCDLAGFVECASGTTCLPSSSGNGAYCTTYGQAQQTRCSSAPTWDLSKDPPKVTGFVSGSSVWEPPVGCMSAIANNRPEFVVKLHLASATSKLVLSTAEPETQFDTGIVVLPSCTASMDTALGCNDDAIGYSSSLTLTGLAAGDYFVIIESSQPGGGGFGLSASIQ